MMRRADAVRNLGTAPRYSEAMQRIKQPGDYVLVVRGAPRGIVMSCPDGCGEHVVINLDRQGGPAWHRYTSGDKLSIYPSVWRDSGCRAHFIIVRDRIYWCDVAGARTAALVDKSLISTVLDHLDHATPVHYETIAASLGAIPWEVIWACEALQRAGLLLQPERGYFMRC